MGRKLLTEQKERPICVKCGYNQCKGNGKSKNGIIKYSKYCMSCQRALYDLKSDKSKRTFSYILNKKSNCELCSFIPQHKCQLDVDHIDGDSSNNDVSNLQTLCANCHRLKTQIENTD